MKSWTSTILNLYRCKDNTLTIYWSRLDPIGGNNDPVLWSVSGVSDISMTSIDVLSSPSDEKVVATQYTAQMSNEVVSWRAWLIVYDGRHTDGMIRVLFKNKFKLHQGCFLPMPGFISSCYPCFLSLENTEPVFFPSCCRCQYQTNAGFELLNEAILVILLCPT